LVYGILKCNYSSQFVERSGEMQIGQTFTEMDDSLRKTKLCANS